MPISGGRPLTLRRRWLAITLATIACSSASGRSSPRPPQPASRTFDGGGLLAFGLALVPLAFGVLAFASRHPSAPAQVLKAMGLFIVIGVP
jgi:hypothetical protein